MAQRATLHQVNGKWFNEYNQEICGVMTEHGPCKNTRYCRFHAEFRPEQLQLKSVNKGQWMPDEHEKFLEGILKFGVGHWVEVSNYIETRQPSECQVHFFKLREKLGLDADDFVHYVQAEMARTHKQTLKKDKAQVREQTPQLSPSPVQQEKPQFIPLPVYKIDSNNSDLLFNSSPFLDGYD